MAGDEDIKWAGQVAEGSHAAFASLVDKYTKYAYAVAYRHLSDRHLAEDMAQQAFLKFWEFPDKFDPGRGAAFKTWFTQVLLNLCVDHRRKNRHRWEDIDELGDASAALAGSEKPAEQKLYERRRSAALEAAIRRLPASQMSALNLGFYQQIPYAEVAKIMKTSEPSVKSLIMRAKDNIGKYMKGHGYGIDG